MLFTLGPINLTIHRGETIFIVGGNGSGKSTFINILTGLYYPTSGKIYLNGQSINTRNQEYRSFISAIFTDNYLFSQNYENYRLEDNPQYRALLETMQLDKVLSGDDAEQAARRKFSKGQSKRMALIFSLLEQRPIMVLDEWAADQDPHFRKYFYEVLLQQINQQQTVIAVTHDDAYFQHADRVLKFDYGKIIKEKKYHSPSLARTA